MLSIITINIVKLQFFFWLQNRIKEDMAASLEAGRQENETLRRSLVEAQERNDVLFKKVRDGEYRAHQLQDTVQKLVS
jgi:myosin-5